MKKIEEYENNVINIFGMDVLNKLKSESNKTLDFKSIIQNQINNKK